MTEERDLPLIKRPAVAEAGRTPELVVTPSDSESQPESSYNFGIGTGLGIDAGAGADLDPPETVSIAPRLPGQSDHQSNPGQSNPNSYPYQPGDLTGTEDQIKVGPGKAGETLAPGTMFDDKYEILAVLGQGGMSVVYKARHVLMNNIVAIKLLKGKYASDSTTILRFQREGQAVSRLNHPNIVRVYDFGISREGQPFLAIEYLQGKALSEVIAEQGPLPLSKALAIYSQVVDALSSAHVGGVIHRDLKPSNIIVLDPESRAPTVKIVDFGIAKVFDEEEAGQNKLTQTGDIFGSPLYMSPEQCMGHKMDDRSDIYSMGCLMYEGLTGEPPLNGENIFQTFKKQVEETPRTFREVAPHIKDLARIEPVVFKCLAKDPGNRYQTMAQLSRALKEVEGGGTAGSALAGNIKTMALVEREKLRAVSLRRAFALALLIVVLAGVLGMFFAQKSQVEITAASPEAQACFEMDKGHYASAKKQFEEMLSQAKRNNLNESVVRFLGDAAVLEHIQADREAEQRDDRERDTITANGGDRSTVLESTVQLIAAVLAGSQTSKELEVSLAKPIGTIVSLAQKQAASQEYKPAADIMDSLINQVSPRLAPDSILLANLKEQYASMLLQKIVNPATPFTPGERQIVISKAVKLLQAPLKFSSGDNLLLARSNLALAQALNGNTAEATKIKAGIMTAYINGRIGLANRAELELRLGDIAGVLNDNRHAIAMYKTAYKAFFDARDYARAAYCVRGFSRSSWLEGGDKIKQRYAFVSSELQKQTVLAPEAVAVRAELQASLAELQFWIGTVDPSTLKMFFGSTTVDGKSQHDLYLEAERLFLESFVAMQNSRSSHLWLAGTPLDGIIRLYFNGNGVDRSVPLLRLKLAVAERTNDSKAADEARNNLAAALLASNANPITKFLASVDHSQLRAPNIDPVDEARALYERSFKRVTSGGADAVFWLDEWFPDVAQRFARSADDKAKLLLACRTSCDNVAKIYGKNSLEYLTQLRWHGRLAYQLGNMQLALKSLIAARDVAFANNNLPLFDRKTVYGDLIQISLWMGDSATAKNYTDEMNSLSK